MFAFFIETWTYKRVSHTSLHNHIEQSVLVLTPLCLLTSTMAKKFMAGFKKFMKKKGVYANLIIGFLQLGLEKLLGMDFACPCDPDMNLIFSLAYFLIPAIFSSAFMFYVQSPNCKSKRSFSIVTSLIPAIMWVMLLFFDGQYLACARASRKGLMVQTDGSSFTWCKPIDDINHITADNKEELLTFFSIRNISQVSKSLR